MAESRTAVLAALLGNGALTVLKGASAAATGSAAMLAETFHSAADTGNQGLLLLGGRLARRPADERHPFGHGKNVYFWAFIVSVMLFSLGGAFSIWEMVRGLLHPAPHRVSSWTWAVLGGGFLFEAISLGVALHSLRAAVGGRSLREYWRESRDPTLPTVVMEDGAALTSLLVAGFGIWLGERLGSPLPDAVASGVIGMILLGVAVLLALESYSLLIGETAPPDVEAIIRREAAADPDVRAVAALHTLHLGPESILIVLAVHFRPGLETAAIESAVRRIHGRVEQAIGRRTTPRLIVVEPRAMDGRPATTAA
jgi:cation diffusion facilitator family transporter